MNKRVLFSWLSRRKMCWNIKRQQSHRMSSLSIFCVVLRKLAKDFHEPTQTTSLMIHEEGLNCVDQSLKCSSSLHKILSSNSSLFLHILIPNFPGQNDYIVRLNSVLSYLRIICSRLKQMKSWETMKLFLHHLHLILILSYLVSRLLRQLVSMLPEL